MEIKLKTKIEIIDETVEFYSKNPRSLNGKSCKYLSDSGANCALARCCTPEGIDKLHTEYETVSAVGVFERELEKDRNPIDLFKPEYKIDNPEFWSDIQCLHDCDSFWNIENKLTEEGLEYVTKIKQQYPDFELN